MSFSEDDGQQGGGGEEEEKEDRIVCLGTSMETRLLAVGTEQGHVVLLHLDTGMLLIVRLACLHLPNISFPCILRGCASICK